MTETSFEFVFNEARKLPLEQQQQLVDKLLEAIRKKKAALAAVQRTRGRIKNLDREAIIQIAEDEDLCEYSIDIEEDLARIEENRKR